MSPSSKHLKSKQNSPSNDNLEKIGYKADIDYWNTETTTKVRDSSNDKTEIVAPNSNTKKKNKHKKNQSMKGLTSNDKIPPIKQ